MATNTQKKVGKIRPPRVQITYDVETGDAVSQKALPFVVGVLADLAPGSDYSKTQLKDRSFIELESDTLDKVMSSVAPKLSITVPNRLGPDNEPMKIDLQFSSMDSFNPGKVAQAIPQVAQLLNARAKLNDLLAKLEGNDKLNDLLAEIVMNSEVQEKAVTEARDRRDSGAAADKSDKT